VIQRLSSRCRGRCVAAWLWIGLTILISAGCASIDQKGEEPAETLPRAPNDLVGWAAKGKASFSYQGVTETARFHWARSTLESDAITLSGPFSINRQTIERWDDQLIWRDGEQVRPLSDLDPDSPALTALTAIPPEALGRWLLGAQPDSAAWVVDVTEWQAIPPWQAPTRVTIRRTGLEIKVIISQWEFSLAP
jgi:outer membrane biogenesis lipoprotein LolB